LGRPRRSRLTVSSFRESGRPTNPRIPPLGQARWGFRRVCGLRRWPHPSCGMTTLEGLAAGARVGIARFPDPNHATRSFPCQPGTPAPRAVYQPPSGPRRRCRPLACPPALPLRCFESWPSTHRERTPRGSDMVVRTFRGMSRNARARSDGRPSFGIVRSGPIHILGRHKGRSQNKHTHVARGLAAALCNAA